MDDKERIAVLETDLKNTKDDVTDVKGCIKEICNEMKLHRELMVKWAWRASIAFTLVFIELKINFFSIITGVIK